MGAACVKPLPVYRPRNPRASGLWKVVEAHFEEFAQVYEERYRQRYGFWRPVIRDSVEAYLKCGDLREGFARVRCPACRHEYFVAYSCRQRCTCPSCHQKRSLLTAIHVAERVCLKVAHRQVVFTLPKRLRLHARYDRKLLGKLCRAAWEVAKQQMQALLGRDHVVPGMVAGIHSFGQLLNWNPHIHAILTCGAFTPEGEFLPCPELDLTALLEAWQEAVFALYLREGKVEPEVVEQMRGWKHSGFGVDQSVHLQAGDRAGIERLVRYITRCPFSLSRMIKLTAEGMVVYKAEKKQCLPFPEAGSDSLKAGAKRNYQILNPLDFLAEFTQHIPQPGAHQIRYYGWYSNRSRGLRGEAEEASSGGATDQVQPPDEEAEKSEQDKERSKTWAMLLRRVFEVDPMLCPTCGGTMRVVSFIAPPQEQVVEAILRHCGLWEDSIPRGPPADSEAKPVTAEPIDAFTERVHLELEPFEPFPEDF